jgi:sensor domain CHASE-containing protein
MTLERKILVIVIALFAAWLLIIVLALLYWR